MTSATPVADLNLGSHGLSAGRGRACSALAGTRQTLVVSGLPANVPRYFAMRVRDFFGNESFLSNMAVATPGTAAILNDSVESGLGLWTVAGTDGFGGPALWHVSTLRSSSPAASFYYGREATRKYDTGARNFGTLTSPPIDLHGAVSPSLSFRYFLQKEGNPANDVARVLVSTNGFTGRRWALLPRPRRSPR
jgi:hypothetical protein